MIGPIPRGSLIVSCQARTDNPLHGPQFMGAMAIAARDGGAAAIRANGPDDVRACKRAGLPVIGLNKIFSDDFPVYITPSFESARVLVEAGADIIALDATPRSRDGEGIGELISKITSMLARPVFADCATLEEASAAEAAGAAYVSTTLSGYTDYSPRTLGPDLDLVRTLATHCKVPVIAEGRFNTPALARAALDAGAHAVVVGTMITNPREITRVFVAEVQR